MKKQLGAKRWQVLGVESSLSSLPSLSLSLLLSLSLPLTISLSLSPLFLSLSLFLFLSLSVSLCQGTVTHRKTAESMLILTMGPLTLHPTASIWVGEIRGA